MSTAKELLNELQQVQARKVSCLSEYERWLENVVEYLESEVKSESARDEDPTIKGQMELFEEDTERPWRRAR